MLPKKAVQLRCYSSGKRFLDRKTPDITLFNELRNREHRITFFKKFSYNLQSFSGRPVERSGTNLFNT